MSGQDRAQRLVHGGLLGVDQLSGQVEGSRRVLPPQHTQRVMARSASEVSQLARDAAQGDGWVVSVGFRQPVMTCPGCADGRARSASTGTASGAWATSMRSPGACTACARWSAVAARDGLTASKGARTRDVDAVVSATVIPHYPPRLEGDPFRPGCPALLLMVASQ